MWVLFITCLAITARHVDASEYEEAALEAHNSYRAKHPPTGPMTIDEAVSAKALKCTQKYADLGKLDTCEEAKGLGENVAMNGGVKSESEAAAAAVKTWYDGIAHYKYDNPVFSMDAASFTQVVWSKSTKLGCGVVKGKKGYYTSCLYSPRGNMKGQFKDNVLPPK